jgi:hypothetical protein
MKKLTLTITAMFSMLFMCSIVFGAPAQKHDAKNTNAVAVSADVTATADTTVSSTAPADVTATASSTTSSLTAELKADATATPAPDDILNVQNVPDSTSGMPDDSIDTDAEIEAAGTTASMKSATPVSNDKFEEPQVEAKDNTIPPSVPAVKK